MKFGSVCSGIEAASVAWEGLGWQSVFFSEIEPFPSALLQQKYPNTPNVGDMTKITKEFFDAKPIQLLVGGTPCQSFSVAGLRKGLDDPRGNLALVFLGLIDKARPRWVVWENVPGVLSSNKGRDFGAFLGGLEEIGYGWAYRVLDAQYFGVPQRRRRVFVVAYLGDWRPPAAVLLERESLSGNPAPSREPGQEITPTIRAGAPNGGKGHGARSGDSKDELIVPMEPGAYGIPGNWVGRKPENGGNAVEPMKDISPNLTAFDRHAVAFQPAEMRLAGKITLRDKVSTLKAETKKGDTESIVLYENHPTDSRVKDAGPVSPTVTSRWGTGGNNVPFVQKIPQAVDLYNQTTSDVSQTVRSERGDAEHQGAVLSGMSVRRLTPRECERLQGFPDDYTLVNFRNKPAADGPRYKALGNSMAVPVMRWIGERIVLVDNLLKKGDKK